MKIARLATVAAVACIVSTAATADIDKINGILTNLGGSDVRGLTKAAKELGDIDISSLADAALEEGGIVDKLRELAGNTDQKVVSRAADAAMERLGPEFGNRVSGALDDPEMASKLFDSIGGLGDKGAGAISGLLGVVGDSALDPSLRSGAIEALGKIGSAGEGGSVEKALEQAAGDSDAGVAESARTALAKLGG